MKFKALIPVLVVDILSILAAVSAIFFPSTVVRTILLLPFLLFSPGYALVEALFPRKNELTGIERLALTVGMSIVVVSLVGFTLNYTPWDIRLESVVYSIAVFILLFSAIALIRKAMTGKFRIIAEYRISLPGWGGNAFNKSLSVILLIAILGAFGLLGYTVAAPMIGERFSEFYLLGRDGKAQDYPIEYVMENGTVVQVIYSSGMIDTTGGIGKITLGIVNHEQQTMSYSVQMAIDSQSVNIGSSSENARLGPIELRQGEKWEQEIGISPQHTGNNQKVELFLFKNSETTPVESLVLWINVR